MMPAASLMCCLAIEFDRSNGFLSGESLDGRTAGVGIVLLCRGARVDAPDLHHERIAGHRPQQFESGDVRLPCEARSEFRIGRIDRTAELHDDPRLGVASVFRRGVHASAGQDDAEQRDAAHQAP